MNSECFNMCLYVCLCLCSHTMHLCSCTHDMIDARHVPGGKERSFLNMSICIYVCSCVQSYINVWPHIKVCVLMHDCVYMSCEVGGRNGWFPGYGPATAQQRQWLTLFGGLSSPCTHPWKALPRSWLGSVSVDYDVCLLMSYTGSAWGGWI